MKRAGYNRHSYSNQLWKFTVINETEKQLAMAENDFPAWQLEVVGALPRQIALTRMNRQFEEDKKQNTILWFPTWREGLGTFDEKNRKNTHPDRQLLDYFVEKVREILTDQRLQRYLAEHDLTFRLVLHELFNLDLFQEVMTDLQIDHVEIVHANEVNVAEEIARCQLMITDYSSAGFDATIVKKPVLFYQFDRSYYRLGRAFYPGALDEMRTLNYPNVDALISKIISNDWEMNPFFQSRLDGVLDCESIERGDFIKTFFDKVLASEKKSVVFIGYNFFGRGGTVTATNAAAEALMEKGYLVSLQSLKETPARNRWNDYVGGIISRGFYMDGQTIWTIPAIMKRLLFRSKKYYSFLKYDLDRQWLIPYAGYALKRFLERTKCQTVISTRESLHPFLTDANNQGLKNRIYYFHTSPKVLSEHFPGLYDEVLKNIRFDKAAFVTEGARHQLKDTLGFDNYERFAITGNAQNSSATLEGRLDTIEAVERKDMYEVVMLSRLSHERIGDMNNLVSFGKYLRDYNLKDVKINVYGMGDSVLTLCAMIDDNNLDDLIEYKGETARPYQVIRNNDALVDFSEIQTFGMIYTEAILNGRMPFAHDNTGSREVLAGVDGLVYSSWQDLYEKIVSLPNIPREMYLSNFRIIDERFSREKVANEIIRLID
jgi:glycosyltransferase involved in cell wall biosynthesis